MFRIAAALLTAITLSAQQPIPKKYDPETLRYMQSAIDAVRADVRDLKSSSQHSAPANPQIVQIVKALASDLKALREQVNGLDITLTFSRIGKIEETLAKQAEEREKREAARKAEYDSMIGILRWIGGGITSLIGIGVHAYFSNRKRTRNLQQDVTQVKVQTNGALDKLKAELAAAQAENERLKAG